MLDRLKTSIVSGIARTYAYNGDGLLQCRTQGTATTFLVVISGIGLASVALGASVFATAVPVGATGVGIPGSVILVAGGRMMVFTGVYFIGSAAMITASMCGLGGGP